LIDSWRRVASIDAEAGLPRTKAARELTLRRARCQQVEVEAAELGGEDAFH
jgi:hypothetical protein